MKTGPMAGFFAGFFAFGALFLVWSMMHIRMAGASEVEALRKAGAYLEANYGDRFEVSISGNTLTVKEASKRGAETPPPSK